MKRPIAIIAGFLIVPACGVVAVLTAQERYNSSSNNQKRASGIAEGAGGFRAVSGYAAPQGPNRTGDQPYYHTVVDYYPVDGYNSPAQFHSPVHESAQLVQQAQQALAAASSPEERERVQAKLREALNQQFDADMQQREKELEGIRQRVAEMSRLLEKRSAAKEQIIELRLQVLAQDADGLGWASAAGRWPGNAGPGVSLPNLPPPNFGFSPYPTPGTGFPPPAVPAPPNMSIPNIINGANRESTFPSSLPGRGTTLPGRATAPRLNNPASESNNFQNSDTRSGLLPLPADEEPVPFGKQSQPR